MKNVLKIAKKELLDDLKNWTLLYSLLGIPLASGLTIFFIFNRKIGENLAYPRQFGQNAHVLTNLYQLLGLSEFDPQTAFTLLQLNTVYFYALVLITFVLPGVLSSTCIVSEKEQGTIESLFTLPINKNVILNGKMVASVAPSFALTTISYGYIFIVTWNKIGFSVATYLLSPKWWILHFVIVPIYSMISAWLGTGVSIKSRSSRSAIPISFFFTLPLILVSLFILEGTLIFNLRFTVFAIILGIILLVLVKTVVTYLFNPEKIICSY